ncbi:hypothetical protein LCGC14_0843290 [marine sediment metagenome]|uniref:Uncharacterized protein n=1 Tax=marine sediment metagenome TaxID=412755 RepID=A0A0F9PXM7_9ZZZZ
MAELVYQTWERITGRPWSDAAKGGFTTGSYADNIALQQKLLGGWNPFAPATKPKAAPKAAAVTPKVPSPGPVPVAPGITAKQWAAMLTEQVRAAKAQELLLSQSQADARSLQEAQLGANPADFVAYELYKRSLQEQGFATESAARSDLEIQDIFSLALGLESGENLGLGQFGVELPTTGSISRSELQGFNPTDIGILSSFLRGGVETGEDEFQGINPEDFFTELEEGLIPVLPQQRTQFKF